MGFLFNYASFLGLLLLATLGFVLIRSIVVPLTITKRTVREPACAVCRYPVAGLTELTCPECGTDLRRTGIITRGMELRRRGSLVSALLAWSVLWMLLGAVGSTMFSFLIAQAFNAGPMGGMQSEATWKYTVSPTSRTWTGTLTAVSTFGGVGASQHFTTSMEITGPKGAASVSMAGTFGSYRFTVTTPDGGHIVTSAFTASEAATLLQGAGLGVSTPAEIAEARDVAGILNAVVASFGGAPGATTIVTATADPGSPSFKTVPVESGSSYSPALVLTVCVLAWLGLGFWIATFFYRRRQRLLQRFAPVVALPVAAAAPAPPAPPSGDTSG